MTRLALVAILVLAACNEGGGGNSSAPRASCPQWTAQYSRGIPACITDGFDFGEPHYIVRRPNVPLHGKTLRLRFTIEGTGTLVPTEGDPPARLRFYIQRSGDQLTASEPNKRWWSRDVEISGAGEGQLVEKVTAEGGRWTNVFGKPSDQLQAQFNDAVNNAQSVGFTFGGMFAGHGVVAKGGPMRFIVRDYRVE